MIVGPSNASSALQITISGANVLIAAEGHCKLADFGASKFVEANSIVSGLKVELFWSGFVSG